MVLVSGMFEEWLKRCRESRQLVVVIVAIALLLDNMLLTTVGKEIINGNIFKNYHSLYCC